jgi:hypothetical protein
MPPLQIFNNNQFMSLLASKPISSSTYTYISRKNQVLAIEAKTLNNNNVFLNKHNVFGALQSSSMRRSGVK